MKRFLKRLLNTITAIMGIVYVISISAVDSETYIPLICMCLSGAWLVFYAWLKGWVYRLEGSDR